MLDLDLLRRIKLAARPRFQRAIAMALLAPNYNIPPRVHIEFENAERVPDEPVLFAMNHTDRYNYWPLQYRLWRSLGRFTAAWVKGKYFEHPLLGAFMARVNAIPTVSRGYLIVRDFKNTLQRRPTDDEYAAARSWVDAQATRVDGEALPAPDGLPDEILSTGRDILGRAFEPADESYAQALASLFGRMMERFVDLNDEARGKGLDVIVFPQGTRSVQLSRGHIGLAEIALWQRATIVPVGCNGCDRLYPGGSPWARGGTVTYRFGEAMPYDSYAEHHIDEPFTPFSPSAEVTFRERFQALVDDVMERINDLLDDAYRFSDDRMSAGVQGSNRFG